MRAGLMGLAFLVAAAGAPVAGLAQTDAQPAPAATAAQPALTEAELDQLVSPIALYSDPLLANVLMAATYPIEVVEADRWADANKSMSDIERTQQLDQQSWHASVKALVATPSVLDMMSNQLTWTQKLGQAVLGDQAAVMAAVQTLRAQAAAAKKLETTEQQKVSVQTQEDRQVYIIEPVDPGLIYVPYYNPFVVYGRWRWADWPPYYFPPPPGFVAGGGIFWGVGYHYNWVVYGGFDWWHSDINMHWTIHVNNQDTVHVESWHYNTNDKSSDFVVVSHDNPDAGKTDADKTDNPSADTGAKPPSDHPADTGDDAHADDMTKPADADRQDQGFDNTMRDDGFGNGGDGSGFRRDGGGFGGGYGWRRPYRFR